MKNQILEEQVKVHEAFKTHLSSYLFSSYEEIETRTWNKLKNQYLDTEK